MSWSRLQCGSIEYFQSGLLKQPGIIQAFSGRSCGNMALHTGDNPEVVLANRTEFLDCFQLSLANVVAANQIHGSSVQLIESFQKSAGAFALVTSVQDTDALITQERGIVLTVYTADCLPIYIYDPLTPAIGLVHAGWRGTIARIAQATLDRMRLEFATESANCLVAIGPYICKNCFQVNPDLADIFSRQFPQTVTWSETGPSIDLAAVNAAILVEAGVLSENIDISDFCTSCDSAVFFSYRAQAGTIGRNMGIFALK